MKKNLFNINTLQTLFTFFFVTFIIIATYFVIRPFILSFTWASMIVITTWPIIVKLEYIFWGSRSLAVIIMLFFLILFLIIPTILLINNIIENVIFYTKWIFENHFKMLNFFWLNDVPIIGKKLYGYYYQTMKNNNISIITKMKPYIEKITEFIFFQARYFGNFIINLLLMLIFSIILYFKGEKFSKIIRHFAYKISGHQGDAIVLLTYQAVRAVAFGVIISTLIQSFLSILGLIVFNIPYIHFISILILFCCLFQIGPFPILVFLIIYLYCSKSSFLGTTLLLWSIIIIMIDNILKPFLIQIRSNVPKFLILSGMIGGVFSFGMIGLFLGPVILAISYRLVHVWMNNDVNSFNKNHIFKIYKKID